MLLLPLRCLAGQPADPAALKAEAAGARRFGRVALGEHHLFLYRVLGLGGGYIAYADIDRWYIRHLEATVEVSSFSSYMFVVEYPTGMAFRSLPSTTRRKRSWTLCGTLSGRPTRRSPSGETPAAPPGRTGESVQRPSDKKEKSSPNREG